MSTVQEIINSAQDRTDSAIVDANKVLEILKAEAQSRNVLEPIQFSNAIEQSVLGTKESKLSTTKPGSINHTNNAIETSFKGQAKSRVDGHDLGAITDLVGASFEKTDFIEMPNDAGSIQAPSLSNKQAPITEFTPTDISLNLPESATPTLTTELLDFTIPDPDKIDIGSYTIPHPQANYVLPSNAFNFVEEEYNSEFRDSILAALASDIDGGGSGLNSDDEQSLFERARDRESATYKDAGSQVAQNFAARGFKMPPMAMAALMSRAKEGLNKAMSGINRDILLKRADMHTQARQFAIQAGTTLDTAMLSYHGSMMERALNTAKLVSQFSIDYHNLEVNRFKDQLTVWKTVSDVKTQWVDNAVKKTKEYELKLAKMELSEKQNTRRIQLMEAMNRAVALVEETRKTELQVKKLQIDIDSSRLESNKQEIETYIASLKGDDQALKLYSEQIKAENLKNEPYKLKLQKREQDMKDEELHARFRLQDKATDIEVNRNKLATADRLMEREKVALNYSIEEANTLAKRIGLDLQEWELTMQVTKDNQGMDIDYNKAKSELHNSYREVIRRQLDSNGDWLNKGADQNIAAAKSSLGVYENLIMGAQSALGTISTLSE